LTTQNNTISPVPNNQAVINPKNNMITQPWSSFFNDLFGRVGGPTALTNAQLQDLVQSVAAINQLTGPVTTEMVDELGPAVTTIQPNVITNENLAQMPANTIKGNNTNSEADAADLTVAEILAMLPILAYFVSSVSNTASALITSASYTNFSNTPTLTFTPAVTGTYKVYASVPLFVTNATDNAQVRVQSSSGSPTILAHSIGNLSGAAGIQANQYVQSVYTLTGGTAYAFVVQGQCSSSAGCKVAAIPYYLFAEKVA
jgi:hypothetical protein